MSLRTERANTHRSCLTFVNRPDDKEEGGCCTERTGKDSTGTTTATSEERCSSAEAFIEVTRSLRDRDDVRFRGPRERLRDFNGRFESLLYRDLIPAMTR